MYQHLLSTLQTKGIEALSAVLSEHLQGSTIERQSFVASLNQDATFLQQFPEELAARLYESALSAEALREQVGEWLKEIRAPWLRALRRREHRENPVALTNSLCLSPDEELLLISGSHGELWSLKEDKLLWRHSTYIARDLAFTKDGRFIKGSDIDSAGMSDYNPYDVVLDAYTGDRVYYADNYRTEGTHIAQEVHKPEGARKIRGNDEASSLLKLYWEIYEEERLLARLSANNRCCISSAKGGHIFAISPGWFTQYVL